MSMDRGDSGYATLLDGLLFLVLVSVGAALVAHTLPGSAGLAAARELRSQRLDSAALDALLDARGADGRPLGERVGEALLARMAGDGGPGPEEAVNDTLARALGPREKFNLTVVWRPVPWAGPEARLEVGPAVPQRATVVERGVGLPVGDGLRELLEKWVKGPGADKMLNQSVTAVRLSLTRVEIAYCEVCGYNRSAEALGEGLEEQLQTRVRVSLKPVREDVFDAFVNGHHVFSKAREGRIPLLRDINLFPESWEVQPEFQALAQEALDRRLRTSGPLQGLGEALKWLQDEQLRPNRARAVLALWQ